MAITRTRTLLTSPEDDIHSVVLAAVSGATTSIHVMAYGLTLDDVADLLVAKKHSGLIVAVVADKTQSAAHTQHALLQKLVAAGISVTITTSISHGAIQHEKCIMIDMELGPDHNASRCIYGSYNFSPTAQNQANHMVDDNDPVICGYFMQQFETLNNYGRASLPQLQLGGAAQ